MIRKGDKVLYHRAIFPSGDRTNLRSGTAQNDQFMVNGVWMCKIREEKFSLPINNVGKDDDK